MRWRCTCKDYTDGQRCEEEWETLGGVRELVIQDVSIVGQTKLKPVYDLMCIFHDHPKKKKKTHTHTQKLDIYQTLENMPSSPNQEPT